MDLSEETVVNENEFVQSTSARQSSLKYSNTPNTKKSFFGLRRRGNSVLAELETISEDNTNNEHRFHGRGNLSLNPYFSTKRKSDRLSQSLVHTSSHNESGECTLDNLPICPSKPKELQITPPSVLRQRIKDAHEVRYYLEKELNELKEFTTTEKQILAVEKGYTSLQEEKSHLEMELSNLQEQNVNLKIELEEMKKLNSSQKDLITDLKDNFDEVKAELKNLEFEREPVIKELDEMKRKFNDEELKYEISESKWKKREDELKKSLEEAWLLLRGNEDKLGKMKENISFLYSERKIFTSFPDNCSSSTDLDKIKSCESKIEELFNLSCSHSDDKQTKYFSKCNCKGDSAENEANFDIEVLNSELKKYQKTIEELNVRMKGQENAIEHYNTRLNNIENSLEYHLNDSSIESDSIKHNTLCKAEHVSVFDKISCELFQLRQKLLESSRTPESQISVQEVKSSQKEIFQIIDINSSTNSLLHFPSENTPSTVLEGVGVIDSTSPITECQNTENAELVRSYEEKIKILESEILNFKEQLKHYNETAMENNLISTETDLTLKTLDIPNTICKYCQKITTKVSNSTCESSFQTEEQINNLEAIVPDTCKQTIALNDVSLQTTLDCGSLEEYKKKINDLENLVAEIQKPAVVLADVSSQTTIDSGSLEEYEEKISDLEAVIADMQKPSTVQADVSLQTTPDTRAIEEYEKKISSLEAVIADMQKPSTGQADISSQTTLDSGSIEEYEKKISNLETVIADMQKPSTVQADISSQTTLDSGSIEEYEKKISSLEAVIADMQKPSTGQADISSQTTLDSGSIEEYEKKISNLETVIADMQKPSTVQADISSQTTLDSGSIEEYEKKISNLETVIADMQKLSTVQADVCLQTTPDTGAIEEYEKKISNLEAVIADMQKPSTVQADVSLQTTPDTGAIEEYEKKISNLEAVIADMQKPSTVQADVSLQTTPDTGAIEEYEKKVSDLEAVIADMQKPSTVQADVSLQTTPDTGAIEEYEKKISNLEAVIADMQKPSTVQADISSQTTLDSGSIEEYEKKISNLEAVIADMQKPSTGQADISSQTTLDSGSIEEYEKKISNLETVIANMQKPSTLQADISSQTTLDSGSIEEYEKKISNLETVIADMQKLSTVQADISSQTTLDSGSIEEYEKKISNLETVIADMQKLSTVQADISSQTTHTGAIEEYEKKISNLEAVIADMQKPSTVQADVSLQTLDSGSHKEYEKKIINLEAIIADMQKAGAVLVDVSTQATVDLESVEEFERKINDIKVSIPDSRENLDSSLVNENDDKIDEPGNIIDISQKVLIERPSVSSQTQLDFSSIKEYEEKIDELENIISRLNGSSSCCKEKLNTFRISDDIVSSENDNSIEDSEMACQGLLHTIEHKEINLPSDTVIDENYCSSDIGESENMQHCIQRVQDIFEKPAIEKRVPLAPLELNNQTNKLFDLTDNYRYNFLSEVNLMEEFIEFPAPDNSVLEYTFNNHPEHSILISKLRNANLSTSSESYDPLASISEKYGSNRILPSSVLKSNLHNADLSTSSETYDPLASVSEEFRNSPPSHNLYGEELTLLKEQCRLLGEELKLRDSQNEKTLLLLGELENFLVVSDSYQDNDVNLKLEKIIQTINDVAETIEARDYKDVGLLNVLKVIHNENIELNKSIEFLKCSLKNIKDSLRQLKSLKENLSSLESSVQSLRDVDTNFSNLSNKLMTLYDGIGIYNNESQENFNNLLCENRQLKEELSSLKVLNTDLKNTSELYDNLLAKYSELQYLLDEKEKCAGQNMKLKSIVSTFIDNIKDLKLVREFTEIDRLELNEIDNTYYYFYEIFLLKVQKFLEECHNSNNRLFGNLGEFEGIDFFNCIEKLYKDRKILEEARTSLESKLLLEQNKFSSLLTVCKLLKNDFNSLSSEVFVMKDSIKELLDVAKQQVENCIQSQQDYLQKLQSENQNLKSKINDLESLESVNDKYSELLKSYKDLETESLQIKADCLDHLKQSDSLKSNLLQIKSENSKLKEQVNLFESEINSLNSQNKDLVVKLNNLEVLIPVNEKYSDLIVSYENLEKELSIKSEEYNEFVRLHDSLKLAVSEANSENAKLKDLTIKYENELLEYQDKVKRFENVESEIDELKSKLENFESMRIEYSNLLLSFEEVKNELKERKETCSELKQSIESLKKSLSDAETNNQVLKEKVSSNEDEIKKYLDKLKTLENLEVENNDLRVQLDSLKSMSSVSDKYSQIMTLYEDLKTELAQSNKNNSTLTLLHDELKMKNAELELENSNLKNDVLKYQNDAINYKESFENLELKYLDREKEINQCNEKLEEFDSLLESHNILKKYKEDAENMVSNLRIVLKVTQADDLLFDVKENDFKDIFNGAKELLSELFELRKNLQILENSLTTISEEKIELINSAKLLSDEIKICHDKIRTYEDEITELQKKHEIINNLKEETKMYEHEFTQILAALNYSGEMVPCDESWRFIKEKVASFNNVTGSGDSGPIGDLERRISYLESQLLDTDHFKRKFSKELHGLKPELNVSDLMKLSLEDLQITMISTIMEKESAVVANLEKDYEMKLALSSDRINQLEEEERRRVVWISEIENENDRLLSECKQIQEDNKTLKNDIMTKIEQIESLEKKIEEGKIMDAQSKLIEEENEKHELEELEKERSFFESNVQVAVSDLTKKLEEKSKECSDALAMLQSKSETIFQLERVIVDVRAEKVHLEEEIVTLKEALKSQLNTFEEMKKSMEQDISYYKEEWSKIKDFICSEEQKHTREKLDLQNEIKAKMFLIDQLEKLGNEADSVINQRIRNMLDIHSEKVDNLNTKIKELRLQLHGQNDKFVQIKNQDNLVDSLKSEITDLKDRIILLEQEKLDALSTQNQLNSSSGNNKEEEIATAEVIETLQLELDKTKKELHLIQEERNAFFQDSLECHQLKQKLSALNESLVQSQNELLQCKNELNCFKDENNKLQEQFHQLKKQYSALSDDFTQQKDHLAALQNEKESLLKLTTDLKGEISRLEDKMALPSKEALTKELYDNLQFEKDLKKSLKLELTKNENEILNLKKERDMIICEHNKNIQIKELEIKKLKDELIEAAKVNNGLQDDILHLKKIIDEKSNCLKKLDSELEKMQSNYHPEEFCPYKNDSLENKNKLDEFNKLLAHERETFKLWKTNVEEDLRCKVLLIGDLESKLKKETQNYKDAMSFVSELQHSCKEAVSCVSELKQKLQESEEKMSTQRDLLFKEKTKLELELKNRGRYESKITELKSKLEEFEQLKKEYSALSDELKQQKDHLGALQNENEDLRGKILLFGDLESKFKKETQNYKEAMSCVTELQQKLLESEGKLKKSEEKIAMQRELLFKEKNKLELEIKNRERYESKISELKSKSEELASSINTFLEKVAVIFKKDIPDLGSAFNEIVNLNGAFEEEIEKVKQLDEDCEELEKNNKYLEDELGKLYAKEVSHQEKLISETAKLREEQEKNEKLLKQSFEAQLQISRLKTDLESMERQIVEYKKEKKSFEINIQNLLEDKQKLKCLYLDLEKKVSHLQMMNEDLKKKDNLKGEELLKELNYLKLQVVHKDTKISKLEMRLESDCLPFQRRAEAAERKIEELVKELKSAKVALNSRDSSGVNSSSPRHNNVMIDARPSRTENEHTQTISALQEEIRKLVKDKEALKKLAVLRHKENKDLQQELRNYKQQGPST